MVRACTIGHGQTVLEMSLQLDLGSVRDAARAAKMPLKILYVGPDSGTSRHRFRSLCRLGHRVSLIDPFQALKWHRLTSWGFKTGYFGLEAIINRYVLDQLKDERFDVAWVDNGEVVGRRLALALKRHAYKLINHNLDNPFTSRDGARWRLFMQALPVYDLVVTPRVSSRDAALARGAQRAMAVMFTADEAVHRRVTLTKEEQRTFSSDVVFVATWMPERGPFVRRLLERGVPIKIFGPRWTKAPEYPALSNVVNSRFMGDDAYVRLISGARIALCLLSSGNQDLHTTRSLEIPAIGTVLCAPRTSDHAELYKEGREAVYFDTADECADICLALLQDPARLSAIASAGHQRALRNGWFNERLCTDILAAVAQDDTREGSATTRPG